MARVNRMMSSRTIAAASLAAALLFSAGSAQAVGITIVNPGFEDTVLANGSFKYEVPNGWSAYDPENAYPSGFNLGTINPDETYNNPPDPTNAAFVYIGSNDVIGGFDPDYPLGLQQTLGEGLQANSRYDLSVAVGNARTGAGENFEGFGGYRIELLAGDDVLAFDETSASPGEGMFATATLELLTGDLVGGNTVVVGSDLILTSALLGVRLIHRNAYEADPKPDKWASEIAFDDVQLTVSAVPVPAAVWLFGTALLGLIGFSKRRKAA